MLIVDGHLAPVPRAINLNPMTGRSLADELRGWSDERLAALLQARPDLASPVPPDVGVLAARAGVRLSVLRALDLLDGFHLAVLDALVLLEGGTSYGDLLALVGDAATPAQVQAALDGLRELALVYGTADLVRVSGAVRDVLAATPAGLGRPVAVCLGRHGARHIPPLLKALGLAEGEGLSGIAALFADRDRLAALVASAGPDARQVLDSLAGGPPYGQVRDALRAADTGSPVGWLLAHALLVAVDEATVELPREVGLLLRGSRPLGELHATPPAAEAADVGRSAVDAGAALGATAFVGQVEALLEGWAAQPPAVLKAGGLGVRELKRIAKDLDVPESTASLLVEVVGAAGLVDQAPLADPRWLPTPAYDALLGTPVELRWATLASAWLTMTRLPGLVGERDDRDRVLTPLAPDVERPSAPGERLRVLSALAESPAGLAPTRQSLVDLLVWRAPRRGGRLRDLVLGWTLAEAELVGLTGRGGLSAHGRLLIDGATREAAAVLGGLLPDPLDYVLAQPDLTVVAPGPLEPDLAAELAVVADVESTGGATVFRVSESSVRRALDLGRGASDLHELFRVRSRTPVPQSLSYLVDDVARRHGRLRVGTATSYLRCDDEALLTEVLAHKKIAPLGLRRLAPTVVTSGVPVKEVLTTLRDLGYAPAAEAPDGALLVPRVTPRRTPLRPKAKRWSEPVLPAEQAALAVTALRAGDLAARAARRPPMPTTRTGTADMLVALQDAARERRQVWIGYVDAQGQATSRVVEPRSVQGGYVAAFDHLRQEDRTLSLHRITGVAELEDAS